MKTICIYHSRDLDGWMSAAIVKKWFIKKHPKAVILDKNNNQEPKPNHFLFMLGWDHGDDVPDLSSYNKIIMLDIAFSAEVMFKLHVVSTGKLIWIDHHESAIDALVDYYKEGDDRELLYNYPEGYRDINLAACELTWQHFLPGDKMPEIVRLLGRYDCFGHKGTDEEQKVLEFQYVSRAYISNYEDAHRYLGEWMGYPEMYLQSWLITGRDIYKYLCTEARQTYKKAFPIKFDEPRGNQNRDYPISTVRKFLCVNQERFNPINFGIDYHKEGYDGFACFWYKNGKWSWSLYNDNGEVDCSVIAKQYSGGGHKGAAGMVIDTKELLQIIT